MGESGRACRIHRRGFRPRKTGPKFPVEVLRCEEHELGFTAYPPGHVPYGRTAVAPVDYAGQKLAAADNATEADQLDDSWESTLFGAAIDASRGVTWGEGAEGALESRRTQGRRLESAGALLGATCADEQARRETARVVGVAELTLRDVAAAWGPAGSRARPWKQRGAAIVSAVSHFSSGVGMLRRILEGGERALLWGRAVMSGVSRGAGARGPP